MKKRLVFFKCKCGASAQKVFLLEEDPMLECQCGKQMNWHRIKYGYNDSRNTGKTLNFIPPMHSWFEPAVKGGKVMHGRKEAEQYAKDNGKIWASDKEIAQEADYQKGISEKAEVEDARHRIRESVGRYMAGHYGPVNR
jgi:hypothetical protein